MATHHPPRSKMPSEGMDRRSFVRLAMASVVGGRLIAGCGSKGQDSPEDVFEPTDVPDLDHGPETLIPDVGPETALEAVEDASPFDPAPTQRIFSGYRGLADLPYFELNQQGRLVCVVPDLPPVIDAHMHLGFAFAYSPPIDLNAPTGDTQYYVNCDAHNPPCTVNLDLYANKCASPAMLEEMNYELELVLNESGSSFARTHTIPNIIAEMDRLGIQKSVVLPIAMNLTFGDDASNEWFNAIRNTGLLDRLIPFASVHPNDPDKITKLRRYAELGMKGVKVHPTMQRIFPDSDAAMEIYVEAGNLGIPVLWHSGRAGIEPALMQTYATMDRYVRPIHELPNVRFILGHAGAAMDWEQAMLLARDNANAWLELSGPSVPAMQAMIETAGPEKMMYGTDWAFYPQALALAKVLIATHGDKAIRDQILHHTAAEVIGL